MSDLYLEIGVRYVHFVSIFFIVAAVGAEYILVKDKMTRKDIQRLSIIDGIYGVNAIILLVAGFSLWLWVGKPAEFYSKNWIFHIKLTMYIVIGLLSIYPTVFFLKQRKGDQEEIISIPKMIKTILRIELILLFIIPLLAGLMAKGIGFNS